MTSGDDVEPTPDTLPMVCGMKPHIVACVASSVVLFIGLLLLVILLPLSLERVSFDEAAIVYDTAAKTLGTTVLREGLHDIGPAGELLIVKTTQQHVPFNDLRLMTGDGVMLSVDVDVFYSVTWQNIARLLSHHDSQDGHHAYLGRLLQTIILDVGSTFYSRDYVNSRQAVQIALLAEMNARFGRFITDATVDTVSLRNVDFNQDMANALNATTAAIADISRALSERSAAVQLAQTRLAVAQGQAAITLVKAEQTATVLVANAQQQVVGLRGLWRNRMTTFTNISNALGRGGDFFVDTYVKNFVLQSVASNVDKTLLV